MNSSEGLPANKPPWSTLTAYDLNKGTIKWQIPWGSVSELACTISDATIRAYDKDAGEILWEQVMPAGPEGIPAVYEVTGREYLAFSARPSLKHLGPGGERATVEASPGAPETQGFYVFALPEPVHK